MLIRAIMVAVGAAALLVIVGYSLSYQRYSMELLEMNVRPVISGMVPAKYMRSLPPLEGNEIVLQVSWREPDETRLAVLHLSGSVVVNGKGTEFSGNCTGVAGAWLASAEIDYDQERRPICYLKTNTTLRRSDPRPPFQMLDSAEIGPVKFTAFGVRPPWRLVVWTDNLVKFVFRPFERRWPDEDI